MDRIKLAKQLEIDELRSKKIYVDTVGKVTGGVGRNLTDRDFSDDEVDLMLQNDMNFVEKELDKKLPWWRGMTEARQNVLANMCFNMGMPRLLEFKNTLMMMQTKCYDAAAGEMLNSKWATQVGDRAKRLSAIMKSGEFPP